MALTTGMGSFDSQASRKREACFAQDDRCWVHFDDSGRSLPVGLACQGRVLGVEADGKPSC